MLLMACRVSSVKSTSALSDGFCADDARLVEVAEDVVEAGAPGSVQKNWRSLLELVMLQLMQRRH